VTCTAPRTRTSSSMTSASASTRSTASARPGAVPASDIS
jgi:hypothetical protein